MTAWKDIGPIDAFSKELHAVELDGTTILVVRLGDLFYAMQERCPHRGGHLSQGHLEGTELVCPVHGSRFDVTDGRLIRWVAGLPGLVRELATTFGQPRGLEVYPVEIRSDHVWVKI
ncbi:MAG TPA: Rieske (2Fe-2S) protein [Chloroflexi bacterium]|jgi:nitrite reductase/ring-hydroxylating ferredoxin subunit|nr:Rieske (2Fe-2S) protein [Chloroflexota bacterium]